MSATSFPIGNVEGQIKELAEQIVLYETFDVEQTSALKTMDISKTGYTPVMISLATYGGQKGFVRYDNLFPNTVYVFTDGYSSGTVNHKLMVAYQKNT